VKIKPTPREIFPELFERVQSGQLFPDSKTFVDAVPRSRPTAINDEFRNENNRKDFDLEHFVLGHFELPKPAHTSDADARNVPVAEHVDRLWDVLTRKADERARHSSLIPLPRPYVVPGGRFREVYYWDSYFTMLGLAESGHVDKIRDMVDNFAFLIDEVGFIPNGNRSYFCSRSQPPYFSLMVELLAKVSNEPGVAQRYQPQLIREYEFWMSGEDELDAGRPSHRRVVRVNGAVLNRYWDDVAEPRQESYAEDLRLSARVSREPEELYRDLRAGCESGWDFSSRWFEDGASLETICTTRIVPVDLNALLFNLERLIARNYEAAGASAPAAGFRHKADQRKRLLQTLFFDDSRGLFTDLTLPELVPSPRVSIAAAQPLVFGIATDAQAAKVASRLQADFLAPGGWVTTLQDSGQQWDSPNGWAPSQWTVYEALCRYGRQELARDGARRWVDNVVQVYKDSGRLLEKYNVVEPGHAGEGGEYAVQDGFGWTNGTLLRLLRELRQSPH
jgi:alpha,alpha-trehalase